MAKLLFIVNGLGLGNSTRCDSIITELNKRHMEVDVLTSGNGLQYFKECSYISHLFAFKALYYGSSNGKLSVWQTILAMPDFVQIFFCNVVFLYRLLKKNTYSCIITDSDYTMLWLKPFVKTKVFALNNADIIVEECTKISNLPKEIRMQYLIERCDHWYHKVIPDLVISPTIVPPTDANQDTLIHLPPIVRDGLKCVDYFDTIETILLMLSGSQFGASPKFVHELPRRPGLKIYVVGRDGEDTEWITYFGKNYHNKDLINQSDIMIINAGFSAVSEAIVLRKPSIIIPVPNHAEQYINAMIVERAGLGLIADMESVLEKIHELMDNIGKFRKAHAAFNCPSSGAKMAADIIQGRLLRPKPMKYSDGTIPNLSGIAPSE